MRGVSSIREGLADALSVTTPMTEFSPQERAMLQNVLKLRNLRVDDVMVPRADIVAIQGEVTLGELLQVFRTAGHSRLPVYGETLDDPRGMIHIRDFLDFLAASAEGSRARGRRRKDAAIPAAGPNLAGVDLSLPLSAARILRPVLYAPPTMPALDLLARMQATRTHMALVIDEYGGTDGLVSIEDIVETVVGNIEDEHDDDEAPMVAESADGTFAADARAGLEEVFATLGVTLETEELSEEVDTLGGLIIVLAGRVPARGEVVPGPQNLEFEVLDADARRVKRVRIIRRAVTETADPPPPSLTELDPAARPTEDTRERRA